MGVPCSGPFCFVVDYANPVSRSSRLPCNAMPNSPPVKIRTRDIFKPKMCSNAHLACPDFGHPAKVSHAPSFPSFHSSLLPQLFPADARLPSFLPGDIIRNIPRRPFAPAMPVLKQKTTNLCVCDGHHPSLHCDTSAIRRLMLRWGPKVVDGG